MSLQTHDPLLQLSEYAYLRRIDEAWVLQSAYTSKTLRLNHSTFQLLSAFLKPATPAQVLAAVTEDVRPGVSRWIDLCHHEQLLQPVPSVDARSSEQTNLAHWQFHDLLFHTGSRTGRNREPVGATYRFQDILPEDPPIHPRFADSRRIPLPGVESHDPDGAEDSLFATLQSRRSRYGTSGITLHALSGFLSRSCRATGGLNTDTPRRPYPSGGARYPLEVYFIATNCEGLEPGLYHYNPHHHQLVLVRPTDEVTQQLVADAAVCTGMSDFVPPILFLFAARFRRTAWKYESIAYHLILIELGALIQTMCLVAEAMGLAACALGSGNSDLFSVAAGTDFYLESTVGEMALGGR